MFRASKVARNSASLQLLGLDVTFAATIYLAGNSNKVARKSLLLQRFSLKA